MIAETFRWWLAIEAAGLVVLPIVLLVFQRLPGRGFAFSKPAGLLLIGYLYWLALSLHLLPNRPGSIVWALIPLLVASAVILRLRWPELYDYGRKNLGYIVAVEVLFFVALFVGAHLKSFIPEIGGTEKPMDFMFLNAASRSQYYPPDDPWLAGFGVSYYYFGYVIQAMIAKVAVVPTAVAFNLALAGTAALAVTAAFGLGYEIASLLRRVTFRMAVTVGGLAVLLLAVIGNLEGVVEFGVANGYVGQSIVDAVDINDLDTAQRSTDRLVDLPAVCLEYPTDQSSFWWWWRATRISPEGNSITEFPFFSFLLGDLHPHVMAIPFVLTALGLGLAFWATAGRLDGNFWQRNPLLLLVAAILLGGLGFLNTWDLPTFGFLLIALVLARNFVTSKLTKQALLDTASFVGPLAVLAVILYVPFYFSFSSQAAGLDTVRDGATRPLHSALFWGPLVIANLPLPLYLLSRRAFELRPGDLQLVAVPFALLLVWAAIVVFGHGLGALPDAVTARGFNWLTYLFFAAGLTAALLALRRQLEPDAALTLEATTETDASLRDTWDETRAKPTPSGVGAAPEPGRSGPGDLPSPTEDDSWALTPILIIMSTALLLILGAELFYVQDVFGSRLNTVFKLSYQAWLLLAISGAAGLWWLQDAWQPEPGAASRVLRPVWSGAVALVLLGALLYPAGATLARTNGLDRPGRTLDGLATARGTQGNDFGAIDWLGDRAGQSERIVEGTGGQYSASGRVSAWTGIPTVLGWLGHETQWGRDAGMLSIREDDVDFLYTTPALADALLILQKYKVSYVFVGTIERAKYPAEGLAKFASGLPVAFQSGDTVIYRVPRTAPDSPNADVP